MTAVPILEVPETRWHCPSCGLLDVTRVAGPHSRMHACRSLGGLTAPMLPEGTVGAHRLNVREDYVGDADAQVDDRGRPIMSIQTLREDGEDCTVLATVATLRGDAADVGA